MSWDWAYIWKKHARRLYQEADMLHWLAKKADDRLLAIEAITRHPIVIVSGSRHGDVPKELVHRELSKIDPPPRLVVHGGAPGVDEAAEEWADAKGIPCATFRALWKKYGKSAGPRRNKRMARAFADLHTILGDVQALAFPGPQSKGTWDFVEHARTAQIRLRVIEPQGSLF